MEIESDAGNKDKDIRQKLVATGHVDVMLSIGPKFFYTRSLPCTLWFFDKGKPAALLDRVLMVDARNVYTVVSARSHVFTDEQLANLSAITWLYRGQHDRFTQLVGSHQATVADWLTALPERLMRDSRAVATIATTLTQLAQSTANPAVVTAVRDKLGEENTLTDALLAEWCDALATTHAQTEGWQRTLQTALDAAALVAPRLTRATSTGTLAARKQLQADIEALNPALKAGLAAVEVRHKAWLALLDKAEKQLRARQWPDFDGDAVLREAKKALQPRDVKKREPATVRDQTLEAFKRASYFIAQGHWLLSRFPDGVYADVPGLCKAVPRADIEANDFSLTPGRYVGVATAAQDDDAGEAFRSRMLEIHDELAELNAKSAGLAQRIATNFEGLFA